MDCFHLINIILFLIEDRETRPCGTSLSKTISAICHLGFFIKFRSFYCGHCIELKNVPNIKIFASFLMESNIIKNASQNLRRVFLLRVDMF